MLCFWIHADCKLLDFYHVLDAAGQSCSNEGKSETHERAVARTEVALHQQFGDSAHIETEVDIDVSEVATPVTERRADVLATFPDGTPTSEMDLASKYSTVTKRKMSSR
jgi:hypothetical protein